MEYGWGNWIQNGHLLRERSGDLGDLLAAQVAVRMKLRISLRHSGSAVAKEVADFKEREVSPSAADAGHMLGGHAVAGEAAGAILQHARNKHP